jgi:peptidyl-tRNA hydrolase
LVADAELAIHGGKLAAQCAHAALLAHTAYSRLPGWASWQVAGGPLALRQAATDRLAELAERFPAAAVRDAGHTQVAAGTLTVVALPPASRIAVDWLRHEPAWQAPPTAHPATPAASSVPPANASAAVPPAPPAAPTAGPAGSARPAPAAAPPADDRPASSDAVRE